jgi:hypothetical protein
MRIRDLPRDAGVQASGQDHRRVRGLQESSEYLPHSGSLIPALAKQTWLDDV